MDIKIVDGEGRSVKSSEVPVSPPVEPLEGIQSSEVEQREIGRVLGIENQSEFNKYQPNLKTLVEFAKTRTKDHSSQSLKWVIRDLESKLGTAPFAEDRVKFITRYAYLLMEEKKISEERKKFEAL